MSIILILVSKSFAVESLDKTKNSINKVKKKSKNIFKTLTRKSLNKEETIQFISEYIITIDDQKGDGTVIYFFEDEIYKRYKNLKVLSEDFWELSKLGYLKIYYNDEKVTWKIQPSKDNTINIKKKTETVGKLFKFSYSDKTDYYLDLEEKKLREQSSN